MPALKKILLSAVMGVIFLGFPTVVFAEVAINEFVVQPNPEWVEFYNASSSAEFLKSYYLDDDTDFNSDAGSSGKKLLTNLNTSSSTYPYLEFDRFLNNNDGDWVVLFDPSGNIVDSYQYDDSPGDNISIGRSPNGSGGFVILESTTKGQANSGAQPSPTPTPTPSPSPSPESEPEPTPSPSPTPRVSVKPITKKPTVASNSNSHNSEDMLLSSESGRILGIEEPEAFEATESEKEKNPYLLSIILVILGLGLLGGTGVVFIKKAKYNKKHAKGREI